jgi:hypothetical protein
LNSVGVLLEFEVVEDQAPGVGAGGSAGAAQHGPDPGDDLLEAEGFRHVVVAADGEACHLVRGLVAGGEEQHRHDPAPLAQLARHGEPVHVRQHHVEHHEVRPEVLGELEGFRPVGRGGDLEAGEAEAGGQQFTDARLVVHDEQPGLRGGARRSHVDQSAPGCWERAGDSPGNPRPRGARIGGC